MRLLPRSVSVIAMVLACAASAGAGEAARGDWESVVAAAEKEGQGAGYMGGGGSPMRIEEAFQSAYPKIKVTALTGRGSQLGPRIIAERRAGKYLVDLFIGGKGTAYSVLYPAKALAPIQPLLALPEVAHPAQWGPGRPRYVDAEGKYIFAFVGSGSAVEIRYKTKLLPPREFARDWDP